MKTFGCCTVCDVPVFDDTGPLPIARRDTLILSDGSQCSLTFCDSCEPTPENLPEIWRKCVEATVHGALNENRKVNRLDYRQQLLCGAGLLKLVDNVPMGRLISEQWGEVKFG